jgi:plastocyanin
MASGFMALVVAACDNAKPTPPVSPTPTPGTPKQPTVTPTTPTSQPTTAVKAAKLVGKVIFNGEQPQTGTRDVARECKEHYPDGYPSEEVIVNDNRTLRWVFVYLKKGVKGKFNPPATPVMLDQKECQYRPHVFGAMAGQTVLLRSSDPFLHNIKSESAKNAKLDKTFPQPSDQKWTFDEPEVMVKLYCDVHAHMSAYVGVLKHPFYAVTREEGTYELKDVPPGEYEVEAWHEKYGTQVQALTLGAGETKTIDFTYKPKE